MEEGVTEPVKPCTFFKKSNRKEAGRRKRQKESSEEDEGVVCGGLWIKNVIWVSLR